MQKDNQSLKAGECSRKREKTKPCTEETKQCTEETKQERQAKKSNNHDASQSMHNRLVTNTYKGSTMQVQLNVLGAIMELGKMVPYMYSRVVTGLGHMG